MSNWIKAATNLQPSTHDYVNFLYNHNKYYISDNHLTAAWCWLQKIDVNKNYQFFHIDRHYDLLFKIEALKTEVIEKRIDIEKITFEEYTNISYTMKGGQIAKVFRYDNYIGNFLTLYPKIFEKTVFATHKEDFVNDDFISEEVEMYELFSSLTNNLENNSKWIINIDIDYFFTYFDGEFYQIVSDEYIIKLFEIIEKNKNNIDVITIALSPGTCGGWKQAIRIIELVSNKFDLGFELPKAKQLFI